MQESPLERIILAVAVGACVTLISSLRGYKHNKKALKLFSQCEADPNCTKTFVFEGKTYSEDKYLAIRTEEYKKMRKSTLKKRIKAYQQLTLSDLEKLDFIAMKQALDNK